MRSGGGRLSACSRGWRQPLTPTLSPQERGEGAHYGVWMEALMESIAWMAWTLPTAIFFALLASTLAVMTWLAAAYPEAERVGILRIPTTRGDRLFVSLILAAVVHLLWIAFIGTD